MNAPILCSCRKHGCPHLHAPFRDPYWERPPRSAEWKARGAEGPPPTAHPLSAALGQKQEEIRRLKQLLNEVEEENVEVRGEWDRVSAMARADAWSGRGMHNPRRFSSRFREMEQERRRDMELWSALPNGPPVGSILTEPDSKVVFKAPFDVKHTYHIKVTNSSARRIEWSIESNTDLIRIYPKDGALGSNEHVLVHIVFKSFCNGRDLCSDAHMTISWSNAAEGRQSLSPQEPRKKTIAFALN